jgi:hypothetical protein
VGGGRSATCATQARLGFVNCSRGRRQSFEITSGIIKVHDEAPSPYFRRWGHFHVGPDGTPGKAR